MIISYFTIYSDYFSLLLGIVKDNYGDVVKFCGDALIIFWPVSVDADENVRSAAVLMSSICALDLIKMCGKYTQSAYTADGTPFSVELALHCGISCGTTHCMILGDAERYEYLLSGEAISYAGKAEGCANSGEVCIHIDAANLVKGKLDVGITEKDDQILQLTGKISTNYPQKPLKDNENFTISEHVEFMIDTNRWNGRNKFYGKESHQNNQQNTLKNTNSFDEYQLKKDSNISNINNRLSSVSMYGKIQYRKSCNYTNGIWQYFNNSIDLSLNTSRSKLAVDVLSTSQISNSIDTSCTIACDKTESNLMVNNKELTLRQLKLKLDYFSDRSIQEVKSYLSQWNYKWDKVKRWTIDSSLESFPSQVENKRLKLSRDLRKFVHETARSAIETHTSALLSEMRDISTVFINIIGLEESFRTGQWNRPQQALKLVLSGLIKYGGSLRQFVVDDKGVVAIGVFGLYGSSSSNNSVQSIKASYYITEEFKKINLLARIGITQGMVYCGLVGSGLRCEFTVIGTSVNLSARLMCASEELSSSVILVSDVVQRSTAKIFKFNELEKITAKGYNEPVSVYSPKKDESFILGRRYSYGEICNNRSNSSKTYQYLERENVDQLIHLYLKIRNNNYQERQNYIQTINKNSFDWNDPILVLRGSEGFGKTSCLNRIESLLNHAYDSETVVTNTILKVTGLSSSYLEDFYLIRKIFLEQNRQIYGETGSTSMYFLCKQLVKYYFVDGYCLSQAIYDYRNSFLHDLLKDTNGIPSELNCCTKGIIQHDNTELQKSNSEILCFNQLPNTIIFTREFRPLNSCDVCSLTLENSCEIFSNAAIQADLFGGVEKLKSMILEIILSASLGKVKQKTKTLKVFNLLIDDLDKCDTSSLEVLMKLRDLDITVESSGDMQDFCMSGCIIVTGKPLLECSNQDQIFLSQILYRNYIELKGLSDFAIKTLMKQALGESRWKWLTTFPTGKKATIIRRRSMNFIETSTKFCCSIEENVNQSESSQEISFLNDCRAQTAGSPGLLLHLARILVELLDSHCYQWREKLDLKCFSKHSNVVDCVTERDQIFEVLDHLGGTEMAVLKAASVIGESFCTSLLSQLLESMGLKSCSIVIDDLLQFLVNFGIVSKSKDLIYSFFDIEKTNASNVYSFKCSRTRNVVYNLLLDSQRKQAHSFIAQYYERKLDYDSSLVHFLLSDNLSKKIYYLQLAAKKAENLKEYDKSLEFWSQLFLLSFGMSLHEFHSFCLYEEHKMILTMQSKWIDIQKHFQRSEQEKNLNEVEFKQRNRKWWKLKVFDNRIVSMDYDCKPRAPPSAIINAKTVIDVNVKRLVQQDKLLLCGNYKEFICRIHSVDKAFEKSINSCLVKKIDEVLSFCTLYAKRKSIEGILKQAIESDDSFDSNIFDSDYLYLKEAPSSVGIKRKDVLGWFQSVAQVFER